MSKSDTLESAVLNLLLAAKPLANVFDNAASSPITDIWVALHTSDPGDTGTLGTNELAATAYTRIATTRSTAGWAVTSGSASPVAAITFPTLTSTSTGTITHFSVGLTSATTGGTIIYHGTVTPNINFGQNVQPALTTGSSITEA